MPLINDTYQGRMGTVSPALGNYNIDTYINLDMGATGASGVTGNETLVPWKWDQGVTGLPGVDFNNSNIKEGPFGTIYR